MLVLADYAFPLLAVVLVLADYALVELLLLMSDTSHLVRHTSTALLVVLLHPCSCFYQFPNQLLASKKGLQFVTDILRLLSDKLQVFDGDRVVTQRANQLYAQSLRGGSKPEADATQNISYGDATQTKLKTQNFPFLWWVVIPTGGAIMAGAFGTGIVWARRGDRKAALSAANGHIIHESFDGLNLTDLDAGTPKPALKSEIDRS